MIELELASQTDTLAMLALADEYESQGRDDLASLWRNAYGAVRGVSFEVVDRRVSGLRPSILLNVEGGGYVVRPDRARPGIHGQDQPGSQGRRWRFVAGRWVRAYAVMLVYETGQTRLLRGAYTRVGAINHCQLEMGVVGAELRNPGMLDVEITLTLDSAGFFS